jgi:hypothetical protein
LEEIQGDAYELFERTSQENPRKAKWQFSLERDSLFQAQEHSKAKINAY